MRNLLILVALLVGKPSLAADCESKYGALRAEHSDILQGYEHSPATSQQRLASLGKQIHVSLNDCGHSAKLNALMTETQISLGNNEEGLRYARISYARDPDSWEANHALGFALTLTGRCDAGIPFLEKAAQSSPQRYKILLNLCSTYESCGQYEEAVRSCTDVLNSGDINLFGPAFYIRARAYQALGASKEADTDFFKAKRAGFEGNHYYTEEHYGR